MGTAGFAGFVDGIESRLRRNKSAFGTLDPEPVKKEDNPIAAMLREKAKEMGEDLNELSKGLDKTLGFIGIESQRFLRSDTPELDYNTQYNLGQANRSGV